MVGELVGEGTWGERRAGCTQARIGRYALYRSGDDRRATDRAHAEYSVPTACTTPSGIEMNARGIRKRACGPLVRSQISDLMSLFSYLPVTLRSSLLLPRPHRLCSSPRPGTRCCLFIVRCTPPGRGNARVRVQICARRASRLHTPAPNQLMPNISDTASRGPFQLTKSAHSVGSARVVPPATATRTRSP